MTTKAVTAQNSRFKIGWIILVVFAALMTLNHLALIFILDEPVLFIGYTAFNLYSLVVIMIPFRRLERWAWYATWLLPIGLALPAFSDPQIGAMYFGTAVLCALGLLLTRAEFFAERMEI